MDSLASHSRATRSRQDPVSCRLCRSKKLKCDRQLPCSNCSARGVACQPAVLHGQAHRIHLKNRQEGPTDENAEILARLKKLEDVVSSMQATPLLAVPSNQLPSPAASLPVFSANEEHRTESEWLEKVGTCEYSNPSIPSNGITIKVEPIHRLLANSSTLHGEPLAFLGNFSMPTKAEAISLFKYHMANTHYLHPIISSSSIQNMIDTVYAHKSEYLYHKPAEVALLLGVFASASHFWSPRSDGDRIFPSTEIALQASSVWGQAALDVLEFSRRTTSGSLEGLQATIITAYFKYNAEGLSAMVRSLHGISVAMARDLLLHKIDRSQKRGQDTDAQADSIELKRRVWWFIVSLDWLLAFTGGPQQGTYSINPAHMCVRYPKDDDIESAVPDYIHHSERSSPAVSYLLQRVRLSETCRTIVDSMPHLLEDIDMINYDNIISLDGQFENLLRNLPGPFRLDEGSKTGDRHPSHGLPQVIMQRYLIQLGIHTRRSKLHQPFLVRGFVDSKYAYSRDACLCSARITLKVNRMLEEEKSNLPCAPARFGTVVQHVFVAAVVLVMDLCFNKIEGCDKQRQAEVMEACRMLESFKQDSTLAAKLLGPLMDILQKHKVRLTSDLPAMAPTLPPGKQPSASVDRAPGTRNQQVSQDLQDPMVLEVDVRTGSNSLASDQQEVMQAYDEQGFDEIMQSYIDLGQKIDVPRWDDLFADLDSYHAPDVGWDPYL